MVGVFVAEAFTVEVFTVEVFTKGGFTTGAFLADAEFGGMGLGTVACSVIIIPDTTHLESAEFSATLLRLVTCAHSRRARVR
jgi:hypothetical protein